MSPKALNSTGSASSMRAVSLAAPVRRVGGAGSAHAGAVIKAAKSTVLCRTTLSFPLVPLASLPRRKRSVTAAHQFSYLAIERFRGERLHYVLVDALIERLVELAAG